MPVTPVAGLLPPYIHCHNNHNNHFSTLWSVASPQESSVTEAHATIEFSPIFLRIWGWSVFLLDPRTSCNRSNDSNEPTQKENCQTLPNAVRNSNFASLRGIPVPQKLSMVCGMPCLIFSFSLPPGFIKFLRATSFSKYSSTHSSPTKY